MWTFSILIWTHYLTHSRLVWMYLNSSKIKITIKNGTDYLSNVEGSVVCTNKLTKVYYSCII